MFLSVKFELQPEFPSFHLFNHHPYLILSLFPSTCPADPPSSSVWATPWYVFVRSAASLIIAQLDIQVDPKHGPAYLEKYGLKSNDAILAEEKHMAMWVTQPLV